MRFPYSYFTYGTSIEFASLTLSGVLKVFRDVVLTIKAAATVGILHRDVKPSNIVVYDGRGFLIDWDVAVDDSNTAGEISGMLRYESLETYMVLHQYIFTKSMIKLNRCFMFYALTHVLCNGELVWEKGMASIAFDVKFTTMYSRFESQLLHACNTECRYVLVGFHKMLFGKSKGKLY